MSILARNAVTGALTLIEAALPRNVVLDLQAGSFELMPVGGPIGQVNILPLEVLSPPTLVYGGSGVWTILPATYYQQTDLEITRTFSLYRNGVDLGLVGTTFTDATADANFLVIETASTSATADRTSSSDEVYVPPTALETALQDADWFVTEATADADTRKTYTEVFVDPAAGKEFVVYRGSNPQGELSFLAPMALSSGKYIWLSSGQTAEGQTAYIRIAERTIGDTANTSGRWCSVVKSFVASSKPAKITNWNAVTGLGTQEVVVTLGAAPASNGRQITGFQYKFGAGAYTDLVNGTALGDRTLSGLGLISGTMVIRAVNANGNGPDSDPVTVTPGAAAAAPSPFTALMWQLLDKPSASGDTLTIAVDQLPADGGSAITALQYQTNGGAWIDLSGTGTGTRDITVTAETAQAVKLRAVNTIGPGLTDSDTKTVVPNILQVSGQLAYFGATTVAGEGGWKPVDSSGNPTDLISPVVSQTGCTRTWSIVDGRLVANGTPDVDNGKSITVTTSAGNITATIMTVPGRSVCTSAQIKARCRDITNAPCDVLVREGDYLLATSTTTSDYGIFHNLPTRIEANRCKVTKHPNQIKRPRFVNSRSYLYSAKWLWLDNLDFYVDDPTFRTRMLGPCANTVIGVKISNFKCYSPEIPIEDLMNPNEYDSGYPGAINQGFNLGSAVTSHTVIEDGVFENVWQAGDFATTGNFRMERIHGRNIYFDFIRLQPYNDDAVKIIRDISAEGFFAINNEIGAGPGGSQAPHNDFIQVFGGTGALKYALFEHLLMARGHNRGNVVQFLQMNANLTRCVVHEVAGMNKGAPWGLNPEKGEDIVLSQSTMVENNLNGGSNFRVGGGNGVAGQWAKGTITMQNTYVRTGFNQSFTIFANSETANPGIKEPINSVYDSAVVGTDQFVGPGNPINAAAGKLAMRPKAGGLVLAQNVGAIGTDGNWRNTDHPPFPPLLPVVNNSAELVIITPGPSMLAKSAPATWQYQYRNADATLWTKVTGNTGLSASFTPASQVGLQVQVRYIGANGNVGPWSVNVGITGAVLTPLTITTAPTQSRSGDTITVVDAVFSPISDSITKTKTIDGVTTALVGSTYTLNPGETGSVSMTGTKAGYSNATSVSTNLTNPAAVAFTRTETWSSYAAGDTFTQLDANYFRTSTNFVPTVEADAAGPAGLVCLFATVSGTSPRMMRRDDITAALATRVPTQKVQALIKMKTTAVNSRSGVGWTNGSVFTGLTTTNYSGGNSIYSLTTEGDLGTGSNKTDMATGKASNLVFWSRIEVEGTVLRGRVWADGAAEPETWTHSRTHTADLVFDSFGPVGRVGVAGSAKCLGYSIAIDVSAPSF